MCAVPDLSTIATSRHLARLTPRIYRLDAVAAIRRAILDGVFPPGSLLVERRIAEDMGISRGPVREALRKLEEEGLVVTTPYKATQVAEVGLQRIREIVELREALEPIAVARALPRMGPQDMADQWRMLEDMRRLGEANDRDSMIEVHLTFHRKYYALAGNALLLQVWTLMEGQTRLYFHVHDLPGEVLTDYAEHHRELLQACEGGSPEEILAAATHHVVRVRSRLFSA